MKSYKALLKEGTKTYYRRIRVGIKKIYCPNYSSASNTRVDISKTSKKLIVFL